MSTALPSAEAADTLLELLDADAFTPTVWEDVETHAARLDVFLEDAAAASGVAQAVRNAAALAGFTVEPTIETLPAADWSEAWKRFFHVEHVSRGACVAAGDDSAFVGGL